MIKKSTCILLSFLICSNQSYAVEEKDSSIWPGITFLATLVSFHISKPDIQKKGEVYISQYGIRQTSIPPENSAQHIIDTIFNVKQKKSYMLNRSTNTYFEVPVQNEMKEQTLPGGLFTNKPCQGYKHLKKIGRKHFSGREVTEWRCESQNYYVTQYYDDALNSVIREEHQDGNVEELREIVVKKISAKYYEIPKEYKKISMQEFFTGVPKFETYQETGKEGDFEPEQDKEILQKYINN